MTDFFSPSHIQLPWVLDRVNGKLDSTRAGVLPGSSTKSDYKARSWNLRERKA